MRAAAASPSTEHVQTREFYRAMGYAPLEVFPEPGSPSHPVLQRVKSLRAD